MNSKWQIYRVGLIDFWYYDEEEFYFLDGRMLLRGANGSGKSVTMQSFIPLLLDGNMKIPGRPATLCGILRRISWDIQSRRIFRKKSGSMSMKTAELCEDSEFTASF